MFIMKIHLARNRHRVRQEQNSKARDNNRTGRQRAKQTGHAKDMHGKRFSSHCCLLSFSCVCLCRTLFSCQHCYVNIR